MVELGQPAEPTRIIGVSLIGCTDLNQFACRERLDLGPGQWPRWSGKRNVRFILAHTDGYENSIWADEPADVGNGGFRTDVGNA